MRQSQRENEVPPIPVGRHFFRARQATTALLCMILKCAKARHVPSKLLWSPPQWHRNLSRNIVGRTFHVIPRFAGSNDMMKVSQSNQVFISTDRSRYRIEGCDHIFLSTKDATVLETTEHYEDCSCQNSPWRTVSRIFFWLQSSTLACNLRMIVKVSIGEE